MRRRHSRESGAADAPGRYLAIAVQHANAAHQCAPGSREAAEEAQRALFYLMRDLAPILPALQVEGPREAWIAELQFLSGALLSPNLESLNLALRALDRGVVDPGLDPVRRRGRKPPTTRELSVIRCVVEAADELERITPFSCEEEWRAILNSYGTAYSTLEGYRHMLAAAPAPLCLTRPYVLAWGAREPGELLGAALAVLGRAQRVYVVK